MPKDIALEKGNVFLKIFIFSRRLFFKEKSPTITVASFFFFFLVRPQSSSRMHHFLQKLIRLLRPSQANGNLVQRVPPFIFYLFYVTYKTGRDQRVPPFNFFSALCEIFFETFLRSQKSPPFEFLIFCNRMYVNENQRVPPFIFRHYATFSKFFSKKNFQKKFPILFCSQSGNSDFPVISSMKGALWVSRKCFQSFS